MSQFSYYMPTKIVFGEGSLENIDRHIAGRKTLLVTTAGFERRGLVGRIKELTKSVVHVVTAVKSHPEFRDLKKLYNEIKDIQFDVILAVGGGSVLDAAKVFSIQNEQHEFSFVEALAKGDLVSSEYRKIPIISVPTTSGTGSEITPWATIWDGDDKKKYSLHLVNLFSEIAIYDPTLTLSVSKTVTISTGLDTLSHALESIWNKNASPITLAYSIQAAKLVMCYLVMVVSDLENIEYRSKLMLSCMYAGLAFSNTQTATAHAISYYLTANKGIEHGIACSFTLPQLVDRVIGKYDFVDKALIEIFGELSSVKLKELLSKLDISEIIADYGVSAEEFELIKLSVKTNQRTGNSLVTL